MRAITNVERRRDMHHDLYDVAGFAIVGPYTLRITFDDNTSRTIDFWPMLHGKLYGPLRDRTLFERVRLDPEISTLVWPNGADFDPATLHDWDAVGGATIRMAQSWAELARQDEKRATAGSRAGPGRLQPLDGPHPGHRRGDLGATRITIRSPRRWRPRNGRWRNGARRTCPTRDANDR